jgi:hypothetical protein
MPGVMRAIRASTLALANPGEIAELAGADQLRASHCMAMVGLIVNLASAWLLEDDHAHHHGHGHHHDDDHDQGHDHSGHARDNHLRAAYYANCRTRIRPSNRRRFAVAEIILYYNDVGVRSSILSGAPSGWASEFIARPEFNR